MMTSKRLRRKKYFTIEEANAALPLVRSIVRDITELARDLGDRHERLMRLQMDEDSSPGNAYREELEHIEREFEHDQDRMREYVSELTQLGLEIKDYHEGLVDFPSIMDNREVYLCWRQGEPEVSHWHEIDAGYAGRQKILEKATLA